MTGGVRAFAKALTRNRNFTLFAAPMIASLGAALIAVFLLNNFWMLTNADRFVQDWEIASLTPLQPQDPDIVILGVTEETLRLFPYRAPLDRAFLSNLLTALDARHVRGIVLDYLLDQPTEPDKDAQLKKTLTAIKAPLVVSYTDSPNVVTDEQRAFLDSYVPQSLRGYANVSEDQFDVARSVFPGAVARNGRYLMSLPRAMAAKLGVKTSAAQVPIVWRAQWLKRPGEPKLDATFKEWPAQTAQFLPAAWLKDKIVMIGSDMTLVDRHRTPFATVFANGEGLLPGVTIQAHMLSQLLNHRQPPMVAGWIDFLIALVCAGLGAFLGRSQRALPLRMALGVTTLLLLWGMGAALFYYDDTMIGLIAPGVALALAFWAMDSLTGLESRRQRVFIQGAFSRYVSPKVVEQLVADPDRMALQGERREMTYIFTDIANFTAMSENLESQELAPLINAYLEGVTRIVLKYDGMVDKFIGDAVFAIFNAPVDLPKHASHAVHCALDIDEFCEAFSAQQRAKNIPFGLTRIGVHTGPAVIGNFGSLTRFNYTAQGDAVNVASRLEQINKHFGTRICVSESTRAMCEDIRFRPIASVVLKGKGKPVEVFEPLRNGELEQGFLERYCAAFVKLQHDSPDALALFTELTKEAPNDPCVALHMGRLKQGAHGVSMVMHEK
ncbi:MAG TPA: adenylate/guanylate cyclase domain-containing protein [Rhizomicrobium sp.]